MAEFATDFTLITLHWLQPFAELRRTHLIMFLRPTSRIEPDSRASRLARPRAHI
jgi:hypothetical protein